jgi:hypothetical protein
MGEHIPKFKTREEEARFWEETGLDGLSPDEYEEVQIRRPERPLSATFAVRLDDKTVQLLRRIAKAYGLGPTQLVRAWVLERLGIESRAGALAKQNSGYPEDFESLLRTTMIKSLMARIPDVVESALQEVLDRADQEVAEFRGWIDIEKGGEAYMAHKKTTSSRVARTASRVLRSKQSGKASKSVAGSALSQKHRGKKR